MKLPPYNLPRVLGVILTAALAACGGGSGNDKPAIASAQISPVTDAASGVTSSAATAVAAAASEAASAASAPEPMIVGAASAAAVSAVIQPAKTSTGTPAATTAAATAGKAAAAKAATGPTVKAAGFTAAASPGTAMSAVAPSAAMSAVAPSPAMSAVAPTAVASKSASAAASSAAASLDAAVLGSSSSLASLSVASSNTTSTTTTSTNTSICKVAYVPPANLVSTVAAVRPAAGGVFFSNAELTVWQSRLANGPFLKANDFMKGSPGDWDRINQNAADFIKNGDKGPLSTSAPDEYSRLGAGARDAAFVFLMKADGKAYTAVRDYLLAQVKNPQVDFPTKLCLTDNNNWNPDGYYFQSSWLLRYLVTYDFVRSALPSADRVTIENFIRRNAYMLATQMDAALANLFPNRLKGDYSKKLWVATTNNGAVSWWSKRYDTNNDCKVDSADAPNPAPVYAYVRADGVVGPRLSELSQFYNNRRAATALAFGAAGLVLADPVLISSAKRYTFEWLTYSVWPDGSQGEYARNGDYCIPQQGVIYGGANTASAALLATLLTRQGDTSIQSFSTTDGLFGSESTGGAPPKTLELAIRTQIGLINGSIKWYFHQPWRATQDLSDANSLFGFRSYYMKSTKALDNYHELGLLPASKILTGVNITGLVMRDKAFTSLPFPGSTGNAVTTGYGSWNDPFNALPAVLLIRP